VGERAKVPQWLRQIRGKEGERAKVPQWLRQIRGKAGERAKAPQWLRQIGGKVKGVGGRCPASEQLRRENGKKASLPEEKSGGEAAQAEATAAGVR